MLLNIQRAQRAVECGENTCEKDKNGVHGFAIGVAGEGGGGVSDP